MIILPSLSGCICWSWRCVVCVIYQKITYSQMTWVDKSSWWSDSHSVSRETMQLNIMSCSVCQSVKKFQSSAVKGGEGSNHRDKTCETQICVPGNNLCSLCFVIWMKWPFKIRNFYCCLFFCSPSSLLVFPVKWSSHVSEKTVYKILTAGRLRLEAGESEAAGAFFIFLFYFLSFLFTSDWTSTED